MKSYYVLTYKDSGEFLMVYDGPDEGWTITRTKIMTQARIYDSLEEGEDMNYDYDNQWNIHLLTFHPDPIKTQIRLRPEPCWR